LEHKDEDIYTGTGISSLAKNCRDTLQNIYEGDSKVKEEKLQTYRGQFKQLKMK
jgi:hypothetical protein